MKKLTITFSIFMSLLFATYSYAQIHNDTSKSSWPRTALPSISKSGDPLIIVDGNEYAGKLETIDPNIIERIEILKDDDAKYLYSLKAANGVILITTKKNVAGIPNIRLQGPVQSSNRKIDQYEAKLSAISPDYKSYLDSHNNDDSGINYIIDGIMIKHDTPGISALDDLDADKIRNVSLLQKKDFQGITTTVVTIETTKN